MLVIFEQMLAEHSANLIQETIKSLAKTNDDK